MLVSLSRMRSACEHVRTIMPFAADVFSGRLHSPEFHASERFLGCSLETNEYLTILVPPVAGLKLRKKNKHASLLRKLDSDYVQVVCKELVRHSSKPAASVP